jgi:NAD-dependent deacetylase
MPQEARSVTSAGFDAARALLSGVRRLAVLTGAGMSAESGVPTFRDAQTGLWSRFDPMQLASPEGFRADPPLVWRWYAWRRELVARAEPNAGHRALAAAASRFDALHVVTQNVDGLHQRAGSRDVLEVHGNIVRTRCVDDCGVVIAHPGELPAGAPPRCPSCGSWLRPDVVWFGEMLDPQVLGEAERRCCGAEAVLVVGTSGLVYPAAGLPLQARRAGAKVIIVNPQASEIDSVADLVVRGTAAGALPALLASFPPQRPG